MFLTLILSLACSDKDPQETAEPDTGDTEADADSDSDADSDTDSDADTDVEPEGFTVEGMAFDLLAQGPAAEGLCVDVADPSAAFTGGELEILAGSTVGAQGAFSVEDVQTDSLLGLFLLVTDCDGVSPTMPTASGIPYADYSSLGEGDVLGERRAIVVSETMAGAVSQSLAAAGYSGDISQEGFVLGFVRDAEGTPVGGATVSCGACSVYYMDGVSADGLFTTAEVGVNSSTDAAAGGIFVVPGGPLTQYTASHETLSFGGVTFGGMPGLVTVMAFAAE